MRLLLFILLFLPSSAIAVAPILSGYVNDNAGLLSSATSTRLKNQLAELDREESTQIVLLTIPSLQGASIEEYAIAIAEKTSIGQKGKDNGALLLIARDEKKIRIEVGYGLENSLTDLRCGRIIRNVIAPHFKRGDYDSGIAAGIEAIINSVNGEYVSTRDRGEGLEKLESFAVFMLFILLAVGNIFRRKKGLAALAGSIISPLCGMFLFDIGMPLLLLLIPGGFFLGFIASLMASSQSIGASSGGSSSSYSFGRSSSGGGGFSGGGGSFGGGGASGGW